MSEELLKHADEFLKGYKDNGKVYFDSLDAALIKALADEVRGKELKFNLSKCGCACCEKRAKESIEDALEKLQPPKETK